jgi:hypothetical protein
LDAVKKSFCMLWGLPVTLKTDKTRYGHTVLSICLKGSGGIAPGFTPLGAGIFSRALLFWIVFVDFWTKYSSRFCVFMSAWFVPRRNRGVTHTEKEVFRTRLDAIGDVGGCGFRRLEHRVPSGTAEQGYVLSWFRLRLK